MISVVIPFFNHKKYIEPAYLSLRQQGYANWELLFIDNNSSDGSGELARKLAEKDEHIKVVNETRQGIAFARNAGLKEAKGEYITFLDIDDQFCTDKFESLLQVFDQYPQAAMAYGLTRRVYLPENRVVIQDKGVVQEGLNPVGALAIDWIESLFRLPQTGATLVRTKVAREIGGFDESLTLGNDDVSYHLKLAFNYPIAFTNKETVIYYRHSASAGAKLNDEVFVFMRYFEAYWKSAVPLAKDYKEKYKINKPLKIATRQVYYNFSRVVYAGQRLEVYRSVKEKYKLSLNFPYECLMLSALVIPQPVHQFISRVYHRLIG
ncbi:MAG: glycosyltransferase family 2 protein [Marinilabiliaceae bacterium]|nr:glycosyltransferase family 2 protein [Marinilabiliaceae bacterium]